MNVKNLLSRRDFLKMSGVFLGSVALQPWKDSLSKFKNNSTDFPDAEHLARVAYHDYPYVKVRARPDIDSSEVGVLYSDEVVPWLRALSTWIVP